MTRKYEYHKLFTVKFQERCEWQKGFQPDIKNSLVWYTNGSKTNKRTAEL
jgi:hypothetical protein